MSKPSHIRTRKHAATASPFLSTSLAAMAALAVPMAAHAQSADKAGATTEESVPEVAIKAKAIVPFKADKVSSPKQTQALVDTPQTITVITKELLKEQGAVTLMEALRNTPGITMQLGENGSTTAGDAFTMRGTDSKGSVLVDGVRDLGSVSRDTFNIEQIEVFKGASSSDVGRGAATGYVNLVSKVPGLDDFTSLSTKVTSEGGVRVSADFNKKINDETAVRLNAMTDGGNVPGRDHVSKDNTSLAPAIAFGLGTPTRIYLYSQHVRQSNVPDGGVPTVGLKGYYYSGRSSTQKVDSSNYYGAENDYENVTADMFTARVEHDLDGGAKLQNTFRWGKSEINRVMTGVGLTTLSSASTGTTARVQQATFQINDILSNQTNLRQTIKTGFGEHDLTGGVELARERVQTTGYTVATLSAANTYAPVAFTSANPTLSGAYTDGDVSTIAAYVTDTLKLSEQFQLTAGARVENYRAQTELTAATTRALTKLGDEGTLKSWKLGAVYKPVSNASFYTAVASAKTPPASDTLAFSATTTNSSNPGWQPQATRNVEVGTKWDLFDARLALNGALYRTINQNEIVRDTTDIAIYSQEGKTRVQGIELGAVGQITKDWSVQAGLTTMQSKILEGGYTSSDGFTGDTTGGSAKWTPKLAANLWSSYKLGAWSMGGGATYMGKQSRSNKADQTAYTGSIVEIPAYTVWSAMAGYQVNKNVSLQLNIYNLFDKEYIASVNNKGYRYIPGAPRYGAVTANFMF
jgi:catecholate siderophore receptor